MTIFVLLTAPLNYSNTLSKCGTRNICVISCEIEKLGAKSHVGETAPT